MTAPETPLGARYLIRKGGYFYRPNAQGYTVSKAEAGRYTLEEAINLTHPNGPDGPRDELSYMLDDITPTQDSGGSGEARLREALAFYRDAWEQDVDAERTATGWAGSIGEVEPSAELMTDKGARARAALATPAPEQIAGADPGTPAYEAARERLVAALLVIGADDDRNGFTALGKRVSAGEAVHIPSWLAMQLMAQPTPDTGGEHIADPVAGGSGGEVVSDLHTSLVEVVAAMRRYEMDVDADAPAAHREMMRKADAAIEAHRLAAAPKAPAAPSAEPWSFDLQAAPEGRDLALYRYDGPPLAWGYGVLAIGSKEDGEWYGSDGDAITPPAAWALIYKPLPPETPAAMLFAAPSTEVASGGEREAIARIVRGALNNSWGGTAADHIRSIETATTELIAHFAALSLPAASSRAGELSYLNPLGEMCEIRTANDMRKAWDEITEHSRVWLLAKRFLHRIGVIDADGKPATLTDQQAAAKGEGK